MNILEQLYEIDFEKINFTERKKSIVFNNTILIGPPKSGKTYLVYDYLSKFKSKEYLYIDFSDYKIDIEYIKKHIEQFVIENKIEVVVFENFNFQIDLPKVTSTIVTTKQNIKLDNFDKIYLEALDFEEFLLFDTKHNSPSYSFNSFLKYGNLPEIIEYQELKKHKRNMEILKLFVDDSIELDILLLLIKNSGEKKSIFQLYNTLKKEKKISKDRFYNYCDYLEYNKIIYFCQKFEQPKGVKKIYSFNHALLDIVSYKKNFNNLFKNMLFLELHKRYKEIYYLDNVDFYLKDTNHIVLAIPFYNNFLSSKILEKLYQPIEQYNIKTITIVTISTEQTINIFDIDTQIVPFHSWALSL